MESTKLSVEPTMPSVEERMAFLEVAVRGRATQNLRFRDWFPVVSQAGYVRAIGHIGDGLELLLWQHELVPLLASAQKNYKGLLCYKLRVIWHRAIDGNNPQAAIIRLHIETRAFQHLICKSSGGTAPKPDDTGWVIKTLSAVEWLEKNKHKLRICAIANCSHPYFIASRYRKTYCSDNCQEIAELNRLKENYLTTIAKANAATALSGPGTGTRLSPEGTKIIAKAAKAMWAKRRSEKGRSNND